MDNLAVVISDLSLLMYPNCTESHGISPQKGIHVVINRQKTIQVQFFNKDNYKRWKKSAQKGQLLL